MYRIILLLLLAMQLSSPMSFAQGKNVFVSGNVDSIEFQSLLIEKYGFRNHLRVNYMMEIPIKPDGSFSGEIPVTEAGLYKLGDLFKGHKIFLRPGDSIEITLRKKTDPIPGPQTAYSLTAHGRFSKNMTFFDELDIKYPVPVFDTSFRSPDEFKKVLVADYTRKVDLLRRYQKENVIPKDFVPFAEAELKAVYIREAGSLFNKLSRNSFPKEYSVLPFEINLSDSLLTVSTQYFGSAALIYSIYFLNQYDEKTYYSGLKKKYERIASYFSGFVKDYLQSQYLIDFAKMKLPEFDEVYKLFMRDCANPILKDFTFKEVTKIRSAAALENKIAVKEASYPEGMERSLIENSTGKRIPFMTVFPDDKITLIDCWATWCYPCLYQAPFLEKIKEQYGSKVNFVYLSFDKSKESWLEYLRKNKKNSVNELRLVDEFEAPFSEHFQITNIPRYILISEKGAKVLDDNMPLPTRYDEFTNILRRFLDKQKEE